MSLITQHLHLTDRDTAERLCRIETMLGSIISNQETFKMSFEDLKAAQAETDAKVEAVAADIAVLMEKLAAIPVPGMTPEQEAALADAVAHAKAINDRLGAIDAMNP
jgi:hypothetical protein